jgi:rubredoxin
MSRKERGHEVRGPPPRRSWRFTALDWRAPRAALHRVDFVGRLQAAGNFVGRLRAAEVV